MTKESTVNTHYGRADLAAAIMEGAQAAGKDPAHLLLTDLTPVDQFHTRSREATLDLVRLAGIGTGSSVLDVGGGIGGAARLLAADFGCVVTVLDLTEEYVRTGEALTRATGLSDRVSFRYGSALDMPFPDAEFDYVMTQHSSMNIADKARLYAEIYRVLKPGGRLALHEIMAGTSSPIYFPVPWARTPEISHLLTPTDVRVVIRETGFREVAWRDESALALEWFQARVAAVRAAAGAPPPPLGLHLLLGSDVGPMFANQVRNLAEGRATVIQAVFERPAAT